MVNLSYDNLAENFSGDENVVPDDNSATILNDNPRGRFLRLAFNAALVGAAAAAGVSCKRDMPSVTDDLDPITTSPQKRTASVKQSKDAPNKIVDICDDPSIPAPQYSLDWGNTVDFDLPESVPLTPELKRILGSYSDLLASSIEKSKPAFSAVRKGGIAEYDKFVIDGLMGIISDLKSLSPDIDKNISDIMKVFDADSYRVGSHLNKYLNQGGYFLHYGPSIDDPNDFYFNYFPIKKTLHVNIMVEGTVHSIPAVILGAGMLDNHCPATAVWDPLAKKIVVFEEEANRISQDIPSFLKPYPEKMISSEDIVPSFIETCLYHESTHGILSEMFPGSDTDASDYRFDVDVSILGENADVSFEGKLLMAHELCALGGELSACDERLSIVRLVTLITQSQPPIYQLAKEVASASLFEICPDCLLAKHFFEGKVFDGEKASELLLKDPRITPECIKKVGTMMFGIGLNLMRKHKDGKLPRV
ncbi:hypothetical protein HOG17_00410 [Candidatus Peregrinibacteria bacterium]|jgi:hypothetical protein|nr:hypothetical protein [Candidatus Peregrinibacteria bacterium]MBT4147722.1 hypothetical protein [Candidatus Peregrinibacteria bacterium]MBT4365800.1 hypothetical protein [Candidatus Peregrinibacteria bacterium]MBT4455733.1 hypothetical protein [Candidatus Peregrinibacteria bacterium]